jgi:N-acylneuraminate cytidylyltransferase
MNVCIIPARGGSVRIPHKNIREFHGKPILAYSIETAKASGLFDMILVSTDDEEISEVAQKYGADVMIRGAGWSAEDVGPLDVARHTISLMTDVSLVCVMYATAPLLRVSDLHRGYSAVKRDGVAYAFSVGQVPNLHDAAQFFWCQAWALRERLPEFAENSVMVPIPPDRDCDINTEQDWNHALQLYERLQA